MSAQSLYPSAPRAGVLRKLFESRIRNTVRRSGPLGPLAVGSIIRVQRAPFQDLCFWKWDWSGQWEASFAIKYPGSHRYNQTDWDGAESRTFIYVALWNLERPSREDECVGSFSTIRSIRRMCGFKVVAIHSKLSGALLDCCAYGRHPPATHLQPMHSNPVADAQLRTTLLWRDIDLKISCTFYPRENTELHPFGTPFVLQCNRRLWTEIAWSLETYKSASPSTVRIRVQFWYPTPYK